MTKESMLNTYLDLIFAGADEADLTEWLASQTDQTMADEVAKEALQSCLDGQQSLSKL